jgi:alanine or glycine:cation symporter, AGCS family
MISLIFSFLNSINDFIWSRLSFILIMGLGIYFTIKSRYFQVRKFPAVMRTFTSKEHAENEGHHPIKILLTAMGGSIGIGNIVGICTAIQIGGPGALFWVWIAGFLGMLLQYSEVYLGMKHRSIDKDGNILSGPMYFLPKAFKNMQWPSKIVAILLSVYAIELFMFNVISSSISVNWHINKVLVVCVFLALIVFTVKGGIKRISQASVMILPVFLLIYSAMSIWVLAHHVDVTPKVFALIFKAAFTSQAGIGGFAGSTFLLTISMGLSRGAYAGDIGIGYNSIIHGQTSEKHPHKQASLAIVGIFLNTFILCTISSLLVLATGTWMENIDVTMMIQKSLGMYFPYMQFFMPIFLFLLGYLTLITYFFVGQKCAEYISAKKGKIIYFTYALISLPLFAFVDPKEAFLIMSLSGAILLVINLIGMFILRKDVEFHID